MIDMKRQGITYKLYWLNFRITWAFVIVCLIINTVSGFLNISDLTFLSTAVTCAFGELGLHTGFIVWKAKVENCRKHKDVNALNHVLESEEV